MVKCKLCGKECTGKFKHDISLEYCRDCARDRTGELMLKEAEGE